MVGTFINKNGVLTQTGTLDTLTTIDAKINAIPGETIQVGSDVGAYTFDASAQTVTIAGIGTLALEDVKEVVNVTDQIVIYNPLHSGKGGTISSNVLTLEYDTTSMSDADSLAVVVSYNKNTDYDLGVTKTINQAPIWSRYTDPEVYTTLTPDDITYDEGTVIDVRGYNTLNMFYSKTASDADDSYIKIIYLTASDSAVDHQELSLGSPAGGVTVLTQNVYERDKAALVEMLSIPTNGAPYMRIDIAKKTDNGTDSAFTISINKAYL